MNTESVKEVIRHCDKCQYELKLEWIVCPNCGDRIERQLKKQAFQNPYGFWRVTTDGDCEGKTQRDLGTHEGYVDEIAFRLADQAYYDLKFTPEQKIQIKKPAEAVHIQLDIVSGTWDMTEEKRVEYYKDFFKNRPVTVEKSNYYAAVLIIAK